MSQKLSVVTPFGPMEAHIHGDGSIVFVIGGGTITVNGVAYKSCRCEVIRNPDGKFKPKTVYDPSLTRADGRDKYSFPARQKVSAALCELAATIVATDPHIMTRAHVDSLRAEAQSLEEKMQSLAAEITDAGRKRTELLQEAQQLEASVAADDPRPIGTAAKASDIKGRLMDIFEKHEDIQYFLDMVPSSTMARLGLTFDNVTGIIPVGFHESTPQQIWATTETPANHIDAKYVLVYKDAEA